MNENMTLKGLRDALNILDADIDITQNFPHKGDYTVEIWARKHDDMYLPVERSGTDLTKLIVECLIVYRDSAAMGLR